ncbi:hypothetical protein HHK36_015545 [Tetracentron sinense]|uniref:Signal recognition particle receptor subunit beta n=1 Tax=Tetracentron sinense TaxID=13715 RepID=A0A834Z2B9_TETSI|nr:hypothetical protein HHK36_015545 [Tetracentron sinense]
MARLKPLLGEAEAIKLEIQAAIAHRWQQVIIESDSKEIIDYLNRESKTHHWDIMTVIHDIQALRQQGGNMQFAFIHKQGNVTTHDKAHGALAESLYRNGSNSVNFFIHLPSHGEIRNFFMDEMEQWTNQLQQWVHQAEQWIQQIPASQLYAAMSVLLLTYIFIFLIRLFKRTESNTIVLAGLSGSGKTVLFFQLRDGSSHHGTVTSMDPNEGTFAIYPDSTKKAKIKLVHVVDVPGHSRLRPKVNEYLPQAAGLVFVVDALEFLPNCRAAAEYLYDILTKASVVKRKIPVLILCNKTDKVTAHTKEFIRKQLEKEIDKLRVSRTAISAADIANEFTLGVTGEAFAFNQCHNKVTIAEASGLTGEISQVEQFIREHVKP